MDTIEAIHSRRSIRDFADRPLSRELIVELIWDAAQAPPPFAGQVPWTFNVIVGAERIADCGARASSMREITNHPARAGSGHAARASRLSGTRRRW